MSLKEALASLHKQADSNSDGRISDHEILDIFQGVRDHLSTSDFGSFLDMVNKIKGPVNCGKDKDCGTCTAVGNAGLCGWFSEARVRNNSPFGGLVSGGDGGNCKFVDRTEKDSGDAAKPNTCSQQCKKKKNNNKKPKQPKKPNGNDKRPPPTNFRPRV